MTGESGITRRSLLVAAGLSAVTAAAGCRSSAAGSNRDTGVVVTDQRRDTLHLPRPARRVVTIPIPAAAMLIGIDQGPGHLAGMHSASAQAIKDGILGTIYPDAGHIASGVSGDNFAPNVETILALNPDLVVQWADKGAGIIAPLNSAGLTVVGLDYGTQADLEEWIGIFGGFLGRTPRAEQLLTRMRAARQQIEAVAAGLSGPKPTMAYFIRVKDGLQVGGHGTYNDFCTTLVGASNPAASMKGFAAVGPEQVLAWDPDIVVLGNFDAATPADLYRDPVWRETTAVRTKRVYKAPLGGYRWDPPSLESPLMWRWLQLVAHPEAVDFDLRGAITEEYRVLYDYTPSAAQLDEILQTGLNDGSADYRRFHG